MELNDHVSRYAADPKAFEYLAHHYTSTGRLGRPMLALHTVYDPIVQTFMLPIYFEQVQAAGAQNLFVQQYVDAEGHCNFTEDQIGLPLTNSSLVPRRPQTTIGTVEGPGSRKQEVVEQAHRVHCEDTACTADHFLAQDSQIQNS